MLLCHLPKGELPGIYQGVVSQLWFCLDNVLVGVEFVPMRATGGPLKLHSKRVFVMVFAGAAPPCPRGQSILPLLAVSRSYPGKFPSSPEILATI